MADIIIINESNEPIELVQDYDTWGMTDKPTMVTKEELIKRRTHSLPAAQALFAKLNEK